MKSPNRDPFVNFWTKDPDGLARWSTPKDGAWTRLKTQLEKHMSDRHAAGLASVYYHKVFGHWVGSIKGKNPNGPG